MTSLKRILVTSLAIHVTCGVALGAQDGSEPQPDPAALKAFTEVVQSYRARPGLTVKSTVKIELAEGQTNAKGSEVKGEFVFGRDRHAVIKINDYVCYLRSDPEKADLGGSGNGTITAIHAKNDAAYFTASDDGSPYYALFNVLKEMPFPELAIMLGEEAIDDVLLQFHPKAINGVTPTAVAAIDKDGKSMQQITLKGEHENIEVLVDPATKLIDAIEARITGGMFVQPGVTMVYRHDYVYESHDQPLDASTFAFNPGERQQVDVMFDLLPKRAAVGQGEDEHGQAALVGEEAPTFVLSTSEGRAIDLKDLRGQVVVLDFWASWCGPCMSALPMLHDVAKWAAAEQLPVAVLTINVWEVRQDDSPDARLESANATWKKKGFTLPILMDFTDETAAAYQVRGIPTTVIIRSDGVIHSIHSGAGPDYVEKMKDEIQGALKAVE